MPCADELIAEEKRGIRKRGKEKRGESGTVSVFATLRCSLIFLFTPPKSHFLSFRIFTVIADVSWSPYFQIPFVTVPPCLSDFRFSSFLLHYLSLTVRFSLFWRHCFLLTIRFLPSLRHYLPLTCQIFTLVASLFLLACQIFTLHAVLLFSDCQIFTLLAVLFLYDCQNFHKHCNPFSGGNSSSLRQVKCVCVIFSLCSQISFSLVRWSFDYARITFPALLLGLTTEGLLSSPTALFDSTPRQHTHTHIHASQNFSFLN